MRKIPPELEAKQREINHREWLKKTEKNRQDWFKRTVSKNWRSGKKAPKQPELV